MRGLSHNLSMHSFLTLGPYEEDSGFRTLLTSIAHRGLAIAGILGMVSIVIFVASHIVLLDKEMVWVYSDRSSQNEIMLIDKGLIFLMSLLSIGLNRTSLSLFWCRMFLSFIVWLACLAIVLDDIAARDISFSTAYLIFVLIVAVGAMPFKGWQILLLNLTVIVTTQLVITMSRNWFGISAIEPEAGQIIYLFMISILLTGLASHLYLNRYDQFLQNRRSERLKEKLRIQTEQLLENEKLKDRFFANISHEFRTPLTLILGPLDDILHRDPDSDRTSVRTELLGMIRQNGHRLLELINQLLDLSKIDANEIRLERQEVNLAAIVRDEALAFAPMAESRKIDLSCSTAADRMYARIDPHHMERVVGNLLSNALKFTREGGQVKVSLDPAGPDGGWFQLQIHDTGVGISEVELPHIFDRFYMGTHESDTISTGTGIGLALTKEIVELHDGTIEVRSEPGAGSEFTIRLPADGSSAARDSEPNQHSWKANDRKGPEQIEPDEDYDTGVTEESPTVLLVDDNPDILAYLGRYLSRQYNVIAKGRSMEALQVLKEHAIDLVISDVLMPDPDGFELCRTIKGNPEWNHIPVVLLTARAAEESRIEGLETGADDYISKPFSASELMVRVENLIELRRTLQEKYGRQLQIKGKKIDVTSEDARFLERVRSIVERHLEDTQFNVEWLADEAHLSTRQLQRKLKSITGLTAGGYLRMIRMDRASQLLAQKWGNVSEVARKVGFQDIRYFSRLFKQIFGVLPSEFEGPDPEGAG